MGFGLAAPTHLSHFQKMVHSQCFIDHHLLHLVSPLFEGIQIPSDSDIHALSTLEDAQYATEHGVYVVNKEKVCQKLFHLDFQRFAVFFRRLLRIYYIVHLWMN